MRHRGLFNRHGENFLSPGLRPWNRHLRRSRADREQPCASPHRLFSDSVLGRKGPSVCSLVAALFPEANRCFSGLCWRCFGFPRSSLTEAPDPGVPAPRGGHLRLATTREGAGGC